MQQFARKVFAAAAITFIGCGAGALAQIGWKPDRTVEIIVGTPPGSGYDIVARKLQEIWQTGNLIEKSVTVVNKPGGFNALGSWRPASCASSGCRPSSGSAGSLRRFRPGASKAWTRSSRNGAASWVPGV